MGNLLFLPIYFELLRTGLCKLLYFINMEDVSLFSIFLKMKAAFEPVMGNFDYSTKQLLLPTITNMGYIGWPFLSFHIGGLLLISEKLQSCPRMHNPPHISLEN